MSKILEINAAVYFGEIITNVYNPPPPHRYSGQINARLTSRSIRLILFITGRELAQLKLFTHINQVRQGLGEKKIRQVSH